MTFFSKRQETVAWKNLLEFRRGKNKKDGNNSTLSQKWRRKLHLYQNGNFLGNICQLSTEGLENSRFSHFFCPNVQSGNWKNAESISVIKKRIFQLTVTNFSMDQSRQKT